MALSTGSRWSSCRSAGPGNNRATLATARGLTEHRWEVFRPDHDLLAGFWKALSAASSSHGRDSDMTEIDLDMERHGQFHGAGEDVAVAVAASRRVKNIGIHER